MNQKHPRQHGTGSSDREGYRARRGKGRVATRRGANAGSARINEDEDFALSAAQIRELRRRIRDQEDRTRHVLRSAIGRTLVLYYDVAEDAYVMNDARAATLFKRRSVAVAVRRLLGKSVDIVECRVDKRGRLIVGSLVSPAYQVRPRRNKRAK